MKRVLIALIVGFGWAGAASAQATQTGTGNGALPPQTDYTQTMTDVTGPIADSVFASFMKPSSYSQTNGGFNFFGLTLGDHSKMETAWSINTNYQDAAGWYIRGQLRANHKLKNVKGSTFSYDKAVLIEYVAATKVLSIIIQEASQKRGQYNATISGISLGSGTGLPFIRGRSGLSLGITTGFMSSTAHILGMPYLFAPHLVMNKWGSQNFLRVQMGLRWNSRGMLRAVPVIGSTTEFGIGAYLGTNYYSDTIAVDVGTASSPFDGIVIAMSEGDGLTAQLRYDASLGASSAYQIMIAAHQNWGFQVVPSTVNSYTLPPALSSVGSIHFEAIKNVKK